MICVPMSLESSVQVLGLESTLYTLGTWERVQVCVRMDWMNESRKVVIYEEINHLNSA